ncbi:MAG: carbamoyltransferase HypF [Tepidisphaeraceae bacterium]|jgi:hydrogenase maturation protein HypF
MTASLETTSPPSENPTEPVVRLRWKITGRVQGVGFRPLVFRLARRFQILGAVWNEAAGVVAEGQGTRRRLDEFLTALRAQAPAAARIRQITEQQIPLHDEAEHFEIRPTPPSVAATAEVAADLAICPQCLAEIRDPENRRRHRYALTNCTNCGPRFSIIRAIPYDRCNTTMADFEMCPACAGEYESPADRRFHAQPTACCECGPKLNLLDPAGTPIAGDPINETVRRILRGEIVAIKGIGGFHLAARADNSATVARLRELKHRPAKPFALMCASMNAARRLIRLSPGGEALLASPAAPIVLADRIDHTLIARAVAPDQHRLGVMLAYTPLHHLIFDELQSSGIDTLVMTSGNDVDESLAFDTADALNRLGGLCDAILLHDRPIQRAVDDSVIIDTPTEPIFVRRARGYVPEPIALPFTSDAAPGLAVGAELKSTVATCRDGQVVLSQHLGNLSRPRTFEAFQRAIADLCELFSVTPRWIACDLHPTYFSTQYARQFAAQRGVPLVAVQHHHAHAAAVLAEHGVTLPALAVVCDGTGYGADGTIWGGELLVASLTDYRRVGRLRPMPLPGGDASARQPWRSAMALLYTAFGPDFLQLPICRRLAEPDQLQFVRQMLLTGASCVQSSSAGRLFDAVAALLGLCRENRFDAEAPMAVEAAAAQWPDSVAMLKDGFRLTETGGLIEIDLAPLVKRIAHGRPDDSAGPLAMLFHQTLAAAWTAAIARAMQKTDLRTVALSGGVFCNQLLADLLTRQLENLGARVLRHRALPPNDGSIAYGQAAVVSARAKQGLFGD